MKVKAKYKKGKISVTGELSLSNLLWQNVAICLQRKDCFKHEKQRHLVFKMKIFVFLIDAQD